jgi:nucleoside-diphosphate-sugar epimerase
LEQHRIIDAAIAAGVKRYVPSEFGLNNLNPAAIALSPVFREKAEIQEYLKSKQSTGLTWTSFACGIWLKWGIQHSFLGINYAEKKFRIYDGGNGYFSSTTIEDTASAVVAALKKPGETANQLLSVSNFATTQNELFGSIEKLSGEKFERVYVDSQKVIVDARKALEEGDWTATFTLIETGFATGRYSGHLENEGPLSNELLGVPKRDLEDVLKEALAAVKGVN